MKTKAAVVTGAGTGVGKAIARALLAEGYRVALVGRRQEILEAAASELDAARSRTMVHAADVADAAAVRKVFESVVSHWGRVDLLVNNAGANAPSVPLEDVTPEQWHAVVNSNLTGAFFCTQAAFRVMKAQTPQGGRVINNGSVSATTPRPQSSPYAATKHAITGLTKAASLDGRKFNIACGQIDIGNAATEMTTTIAKGVLQADGSIAAEATIDAGYVARAVCYMASLPLEANVLTMTVMATQMPFVGRG